MSFKVRIVFTGLCSFILNRDATQRVRACVVLPDGEGAGPREILLKKAPDGTALVRHRAFARFNLLQLDRISNKADLPGTAEGLWYIEGKRLAFRFQEGTVDNSFKVDHSVPDHLLGMDELAGSFADDFPDIVQANPPAGVVTSQILLHRGLLKNEIALPNLATWVVPSTLNGKTPPPLLKILTHEVTLELLDISAVEIVATPLAGGPQEIVKLVAVGGEDVTITISHLCSDNPLRWAARDKKQTDDEDYKWHYTLLSPAVQANLALNVLGGLPLPVPLVPLQFPGGQGVNCPPSIGLPRNINLDAFL